MESESSSPIFKVSRVLWFPMSVNAVALGAACCVLFWIWTFAILAATGGTGFDRTMEYFSSFDGRVGTWLITGSAGVGSNEIWIFALQALGAYVLWAIGGVAIARIMAVRIARDEYITIREAVRFAWSTRFTALLYAPAILLSMLFLWLAIFAIGAIGWIPWVGWILSAVLLPVTVFFTILVRILACAGVISLGMTAGAIACEKKGTWDSVAKAFNYVFARPLAVLLYLALLYWFVWFVQGILLEGGYLRVHVAKLLTPFWSKGPYADIARGDFKNLSGLASVAAFLHAAVYWVIDALIVGAILSWIIGAFTSMFLIFRKEVDGTDYADIVKTPETTPPSPASPA